MPSISLSMSGSLDDRLTYTDFFSICELAMCIVPCLVFACDPVLLFIHSVLRVFLRQPMRGH